jgi:hypothetical protein
MFVAEKWRGLEHSSIGWELMRTLEAERTLRIINELTNPVETIANLLFLIRQDPRDPDSVMKYLQLADSQVNCLIEIVQRNHV